MENQNSFTKVTTENWSSRIKGSLRAVLFGLLLFLTAFVVLWWNEGRAIKTTQGLNEGFSQVVKADVNSLNEANSGKLIHLSGKIISDELLKDDEFGLQINALKLRRNVEVYQWREESKNKKQKEVGGSEKTTTTYTYKKEWDRNLINSNNFKITEGHINPAAFPYNGFTQKVENASIGAYSLSPSLLTKINNFSSYPINKLDTAIFKNSRLLKEGFAIISDGNSMKQKIYIGNGSNSAPEIGDTKISYEVVNSGGDYSLVAKQVGSTFEKFNTSTGTSIEMIDLGVISHENMFHAAQKSNTIITWILRLVGFILMFFGLTLIFKPLVVLADVLPLLGKLLQMGISLFSGILSFALSFITIALAWIFYRPILGIALLAVGIGAILFFYMRASQKRKLATVKKE